MASRKKYLGQGNEVEIFDTKFGKIGLIICWNLIFPEIFRKMVNKKVNIVICPNYWTLEDTAFYLKYNKDSEIVLIDGMCVARYSENIIITVYCNPAVNVIFPKYKATLIGHS